VGRVGDDFYALRPYVVGDDMRKVHWPSTARRDELMVRQDELPWQGRVTIPQPLRDYAALQRDCVVIGANTRLEIWDAAAWEAYEADQNEAFSAAQEEVLPGVL